MVLQMSLDAGVVVGIAAVTISEKHGGIEIAPVPRLCTSNVSVLALAVLTHATVLWGDTQHMDLGVV